MNVKIGDKLFLHRWVYRGFTQMSFWKIVVVTRMTKTLIFVTTGDKDIKFNKRSFGTNLLQIDEETKNRVAQDNDALKHHKLQTEFYNYKWETLTLETLQSINEILLSVEKRIKEQ